jgi:hypothetical protein
VSSNLNFQQAQTVANQVIVPVSGTGQIVLFSSAATHLIADISGYFSSTDNASPIGGLFHAVEPFRLMDTRNGLGASTPGPQQQVKVKVGQGGRTGRSSRRQRVVGRAEYDDRRVDRFRLGHRIPDERIYSARLDHQLHPGAGGRQSHDQAGRRARLCFILQFVGKHADCRRYHRVVHVRR